MKHPSPALIADAAGRSPYNRDLSDATYARVKAVLGERGILDLVAVLGYYSLIAMSMKTFALKPEGIPDPFTE